MQIRWFIGKKKWVQGQINRKIGNKLYEVEVGNKKFVRHIDHIIQIRSGVNMRAGGGKIDAKDWYDSVVTSDSNTELQRRYPERVRRPVIRYGIDE